MPRPWATPIKATPRVETVPHDVPVAKATKAVASAAPTRKNRAEIRSSPVTISRPVTPEAAQAATSTPTLAKMPTVGPTFLMYATSSLFRGTVSFRLGVYVYRVRVLNDFHKAVLFENLPELMHRP